MKNVQNLHSGGVTQWPLVVLHTCIFNCIWQTTDSTLAYLHIWFYLNGNETKFFALLHVAKKDRKWLFWFVQVYNHSLKGPEFLYGAYFKTSLSHKTENQCKTSTSAPLNTFGCVLSRKSQKNALCLFRCFIRLRSWDFGAQVNISIITSSNRISALWQNVLSFQGHCCLQKDVECDDFMDSLSLQICQIGMLHSSLSVTVLYKLCFILGLVHNLSWWNSQTSDQYGKTKKWLIVEPVACFILDNLGLSTCRLYGNCWMFADDCKCRPTAGRLNENPNAIQSSCCVFE